MCFVKCATKKELVIKFCVKLQDNVPGTFNKLSQNYGDRVLSLTKCFGLNKAFFDKQKALEDELCSGRLVI